MARQGAGSMNSLGSSVPARLPVQVRASATASGGHFRCRPARVYQSTSSPPWRPAQSAASQDRSARHHALPCRRVLPSASAASQPSPSCTLHRAKCRPSCRLLSTGKKADLFKGCDRKVPCTHRGPVKRYQQRQVGVRCCSQAGVRPKDLQPTQCGSHEPLRRHGSAQGGYADPEAHLGRTR